tara:strand:- start:99 stop:353 length:255 start_codon:yes stop_codon:yes gene_type:complete
MFIRKFKMSRKDVRNYAISYLWHKAIADQEKARLSLELLTNNAAGIGDHSTGDFHQNLDEALDLLVDATDRLEALSELYPDLDN